MAQQYELIAGAGTPGVWRGQVYAAPNTAFMLFECAACAAIVRDKSRHDAWHDAHGG
jgi:hypothetical protein